MMHLRFMTAQQRTDIAETVPCLRALRNEETAHD